MEKINILINGLPGNVARIMAAAAINDSRFSTLPFSLTGPDIRESQVRVDTTDFTLVKPRDRDQVFTKLQNEYPGLIAVDYTHPSAVNDNAQFYTQNRIPFVMGTTGGDRNALEETVKKSKTPAVIAPNMAKTDRWVPGHDGVRGKNLSRSVFRILPGSPGKPPAGQGRYLGHGPGHGGILQYPGA